MHVTWAPSQQIACWEERRRNDPFCVEWDVKPQLSQSTWGIENADDKLKKLLSTSSY